MRHLLIFIFLFIGGCKVSKPIAAYDNMVGDIPFNPKLDDKNFFLCSKEPLYQYFHFTGRKGWIDFKPAVDSIILKKFVRVKTTESGLIRIRFIINCKGEAGRFRILEMDDNYQNKIFNEKITSQLLNLTRSIKAWQIQTIQDKPVDYYMYLIFKIKNGALREILP